MLGIADLIAAAAPVHAQRWESVAEQIDRIPEPTLAPILKGLRELVDGPCPEQVKVRIWNALRSKARQHRAAQGLAWALPQGTVELLEAAVDALTPADSIERNLWLFEAGVIHSIGNQGEPTKERMQQLLDLQIAAVEEVWGDAGFDGLVRLAGRATLAWEVGIAIERSQLQVDDEQILPLFDSEGRLVVLCARGYFGSRFANGGWDWVTSLPLEKWPPEQVVPLLETLPLQPRVWQIAASVGEDVEKEFWAQTRGFAGDLAEDEVRFVASKLLETHRPFTTLNLVGQAMRLETTFSADFLMSILEAAVFPQDEPSEEPSDIQMIQYEIKEMLGVLQSDPATDPSRLGQLEWTCINLFKYEDYTPITLHRHLANNPAFFAELVALNYRPQSERGKPRKEPVDSQAQATAEQAHLLLENWNAIPGLDDGEGAIDQAQLSAWVAAAREECAAVDRPEIGDLLIGKLLSHAPSDSDDTWPCLAVRNVMEDLNSEEVFRGFDCQVFNNRGSTFRDLKEGGAQERELARKYEEFAEKIQAGWPRVAGVLRRISESYRHDAASVDERHKIH